MTAEALDQATEPVVQLNDCVRDSFDALEALQEELTQWQEELTRQQTELEARQTEHELLEQQERNNFKAADAQVVKLTEELDTLRAELAQLEEEGADQLQAIEELERELAVAKAELAAEREHASQTKALIDEQREHSEQQQASWGEEFANLRTLIESQTELLATKLNESNRLNQSDGEQDFSDSNLATEADGEEAPRSRASELRRRAKSRQASQRRSK